MSITQVDTQPKESPQVQAKIEINSIPEHLYDYYLNKYTPDDITTLIRNTVTTFDTWLNTYCGDQMPATALPFKDGNIAVLYKDSSNNCFFWSSNTNKIYYYDHARNDLENKDGITIPGFLDVSQKDFQAFKKIPVTQEYHTEAAVVTEGIKEFFGYGEAIRIFIECKVNKNQRVFDKYSYAIVDALLNYTDRMIKPKEFENMLQHKSIIEVYNNHDLASRDELRSMPADPHAIKDGTQMQLSEIIKKYGDYNTESIYEIYAQCRLGAICFEKCKPYLKSYIGKSRALQLSINQSVNGYLDEYIESPLYILGTYNPILFSFDLSAYIRAGIAGASNRLERFANSDLLVKFESDMDAICKIITNISYQAGIKAYYYYRASENEVKKQFKGTCIIKFGDTSDLLPIKYSLNDTPDPKKIMARINQKFFEYMSSPEGDLDSLVSISEEFTPEMIEETVQIVQERELVRQIAHNVRAGAETVGRVAHKVAYNLKQLYEPVMKQIREIIDDDDKERKELDKEIVITGSNFLKLKRLFRYSLYPNARDYILFGPCKAIILYFVRSYFKTDDSVTRDNIKRELETELKLTREKIEDARSNGETQKKYQLMRIESDLENELARIMAGD